LFSKRQPEAAIETATRSGKKQGARSVHRRGAENAEQSGRGGEKAATQAYTMRGAYECDFV
jgi:hypothetical protein